MRKITWIALVIVLASCSSPQKMVYYFDHYDYKTADKAKPDGPVISEESTINATIETPSDNSLVATSDPMVLPAVPVERGVAGKPALSREEAIASIKNMSKDERKEFKRELKNEIKKFKKNPAPKATKAMGHDMRYAAIFGAIGIVLLIIGGDVLTILGAVALIIGLYFFIRWLSTQ